MLLEISRPPLWMEAKFCSSCGCDCGCAEVSSFLVSTSAEAEAETEIGVETGAIDEESSSC